MKHLLWFGYKIDHKKVHEVVSKSLEPFGIFIDDLVLQIRDYSRIENEDFGEKVAVPRLTTRNFLVKVKANQIGFKKLRDFICLDCGARMQSPIQLSPGPLPFFIEFETLNNLDSIENFLRMNNDHHQQATHRSRDY